MKIRIDWRETVWRNAARYYEEAKRARAKAEGARRAAEETKKKIAVLQQKLAEVQATPPEKPKIRVKEAREREWFERFHWTHTTDGLLIIAGKNAKQNELLVARHLEANDLFFHADVHGAAATILKNGANASEQTRREAAQFAGCYSSAWKAGSGVVDVYAVHAEQVSKQARPGEFVAKGAFVIRGKREWFKNTELALRITAEGQRVLAFPAIAKPVMLETLKAIEVVPGSLKKEAAAKKIAVLLNSDENEVLRALPGDCEIKERLL